ncbi:MAG TPA: bifunctional adenosylcobinamide kinase/adenosylcobinamide-phosphate guanylyltransferase [Candidatus Binataceae bacterium]|nr:bifunctional adenosylcobinamide kinase/adenosylcobinamide-phosphate guanylyltransferase [Candidatus Binataceae bacterium]
MPRRITLVTGGARSGKSAHALSLAQQCPGLRRFFIATAQGLDDEMRERIARHRADRSADFETIEEPVRIVAALAALEGRADTVVIDCLTLWLSNLLGQGLADAAIGREVEELVATLATASYSVIVVTDEVGSGIVPVNPLARRFRDRLGWINQAVAGAADSAILMAAGYPLSLK